MTVGKVSKMTLTDKGVDVMLNIDKSHENIPKDTKAVVANRSAVGEQFVDLQPQTKDKPYLTDGSDIPTNMTETPIETPSCSPTSATPLSRSTRRACASRS